VTEAQITSYPDEELQFRCQVVKANGKTIVTPIKGLDPTKIDSTASLSQKVESVNELYSGLTKKKISDHLTGVDSSLTYTLNRVQRRFRKPIEELQLCFLEYKEEGLPTNKEIEFMTDQAYVYSDITPIPMLSHFKERITNVVTKKGKKQYSPNDTKFAKIQEYILEAIETIEQLNNKPIMGYIPDYRYYFEELVKLYIDKGVNTFYFDAHLSNPITLQGSLRALMRELNKAGALEASFIHMLNPGYGRGIKDNPIIPAKDILGFGLGIDSLGERHMRRIFSREVLENMKKNPDNRSRLFNKNSYGYLKTSVKEKITDFYPNDSGIDIQNFLTSTKPDAKIQNSFNVEQLSLEGIELRDKVKASETVLNYLNEKSDVREDDIKILKRAKIKEKK